MTAANKETRRKLARHTVLDARTQAEMADFEGTVGGKPSSGTFKE